jgi:hypothetical protein
MILLCPDDELHSLPGVFLSFGFSKAGHVDVLKVARWLAGFSLLQYFCRLSVATTTVLEPRILAGCLSASLLKAISPRQFCFGKYVVGRLPEASSQLFFRERRKTAHSHEN